MEQYKQKLQKGSVDFDGLVKGLTEKVEDILKKSGHDVTLEVRTKIQELLVSTQINPIVSRMGPKELEALRDFAMSRASYIRLDYLQNNPALQFLLSEGLVICGQSRPLKDTPSLSEVTCVISDSGKRIAWILLDVAKISLQILRKTPYAKVEGIFLTSHPPIPQASMVLNHVILTVLLPGVVETGHSHRT